MERNPERIKRAIDNTEGDFNKYLNKLYQTGKTPYSIMTEATLQSLFYHNLYNELKDDANSIILSEYCPFEKGCKDLYFKIKKDNLIEIRKKYDLTNLDPKSKVKGTIKKYGRYDLVIINKNLSISQVLEIKGLSNGEVTPGSGNLHRSLEDFYVLTEFIHDNKLFSDSVKSYILIFIFNESKKNQRDSMYGFLQDVYDVYSRNGCIPRIIFENSLNCESKVFPK